MKTLMTVAALFSACGFGPELPQDPETVQLVPGHYSVDVTKFDARGECGWVADVLFVGLDVDGNAHVKSPLPGLLNCRTTYPTGGVLLECKGTGSTFTAQAVVTKGGTQARGSAKATSDVLGCKAADLTFRMWVEQ